MKKISIVVPCYNEEENVVQMGEALTKIMDGYAGKYDYEIIFMENCSSDHTRVLLRKMCQSSKKMKAILNAKNFGQFNSPYYGLLQASGDCAILVCCDFQDPLYLLPQFILEWENGFKIVIGQKVSSMENKFMYFLRSCYYKLIKKYSNVEQIEHFTGFGLYDRDFLNVLRNLNDSTPFLRGIVAELGYRRKVLPYEQQKRRNGKSSNNFYSLYDAAMLSFTSYTKIGMRIATFTGVAVSVLSFITALVYLILKLVFWERFPAGNTPILIGMFFLGAVQLLFMGMLGEYILSIHARVMNRPLVIEEERINFEEEDREQKFQ